MAFGEGVAQGQNDIAQAIAIDRPDVASLSVRLELAESVMRAVGVDGPDGLDVLVAGPRRDGENGVVDVVEVFLALEWLGTHPYEAHHGADRAVLPAGQEHKVTIPIGATYTITLTPEAAPPGPEGADPDPNYEDTRDLGVRTIKIYAADYRIYVNGTASSTMDRQQAKEEEAEKDDVIYLLPEVGAAPANPDAATLPKPFTATLETEIRSPINLVLDLSTPQDPPQVEIADVTLSGKTGSTPTTTLTPLLPSLEDDGTSVVATHSITGTSDEEDMTVAALSVEIVPDWNRDGIIDDEDRDRVSAERPWRWWVNDDDDEGDEANNDTPLGSGHPDSDTALGNDRVDGLCDLLDFFPLFFDISQLLEILPPDTHRYYLQQDVTALNFAYTDLKPEEAGKFLTDDEVSDELQNARTYMVLASGHKRLTTEFLEKIKDEGKGVLLFEGGLVSSSPLKLKVFKDGQEFLKLSFPIEIQSVKHMYRWINLRSVAGDESGRATNLQAPSNRPDDETNGKMFIAVHGYNVNEGQSEGFAAEIFKRLYQSGANCMFTAVSWYGNDSQVKIGQEHVTSDYWENVTHAFRTSQALANQLAAPSMPGSSKVIAAHSLGNMLVSSAMNDHGLTLDSYLAFNSAVPIEAHDPATLELVNMRHKSWEGYDRRLWAAEWHDLFDDGDGRKNLSWRGRLSDIATPIHNFYSSGEEVLNNTVDGEYNSNILKVVVWNKAEWAFITQELGKGDTTIAANITLDSQAGWGFNRRWYREETIMVDPGTTSTQYTRREPDDTDDISDGDLREEPFFRRFQDPRLTDPDEGSAAAAEPLTRAKTLAEAIPALSFATGRNPVAEFGNGNNYDMQAFTNDDDAWPAARLEKEKDKLPNSETGRWKHGDFKDVAYRFNYLLYKKWIEIGALE